MIRLGKDFMNGIVNEYIGKKSDVLQRLMNRGIKADIAFLRVGDNPASIKYMEYKSNFIKKLIPNIEIKDIVLSSESIKSPGVDIVGAVSDYTNDIINWDKIDDRSPNKLVGLLIQSPIDRVNAIDYQEYLNESIRFMNVVAENINDNSSRYNHIIDLDNLTDDSVKDLKRSLLDLQNDVKSYNGLLSDGDFIYIMDSVTSNRPTLYVQEYDFYFKMPCTTYGIFEVLREIMIQRYNENKSIKEIAPFMGNRVLIIGKSELVGKPTRLVFEELGYTVTVASSRTPDETISKLIKESSIVVSAVGSHCIDITDKELDDSLKVLIDIGINREYDPEEDKMKTVGDFIYYIDDMENKYPETYYTAVPNGMGIMTKFALAKYIIMNYFHMYSKTYFEEDVFGEQ